MCKVRSGRILGLKPRRKLSDPCSHAGMLTSTDQVVGPGLVEGDFHNAALLKASQGGVGCQGTHSCRAGQGSMSIIGVPPIND
jgi:hypothetical protein